MNLASLPMYALPALEEITQAWWAGLAGHLERAGLDNVPHRLTQPKDPEAHWRDPNLLFSQTCGYPLTHALAGRVRLVATPCYDVEGCSGPDYRSVIVVAVSSAARELADMRDTRCAVNEASSHSGYNILRAMAAPQAREGRFFSEVLVSGSHRCSIGMVGTGAADIAAVDCVTYALLEAYAPSALANTRLLCMSPSAPGLPFITGAGTSDDDLSRLKAALHAGFADPGLAELRAALRLGGVTELGIESYGRIAKFEHDATELGFSIVS